MAPLSWVASVCSGAGPGESCVLSPVPRPAKGRKQRSPGLCCLLAQGNLGTGDEMGDGGSDAPKPARAQGIGFSSWQALLSSGKNAEEIDNWGWGLPGVQRGVSCGGGSSGPALTGASSLPASEASLPGGMELGPELCAWAR